MSEEWQAYVKDPRAVCKYGLKCYQKNPDHHKTFKHPPQNLKRKNKIHTPNSKRFKPSPEVSPRDAKDTSPDQNASDHDVTSKDTNENKTVITSKAVEESVASTSITGKNEYTTAHTIKLPEEITYYKDTDFKTIQELFLTEMPPDFYKFYECLKEDIAFERALASVNLELIGPYEFLLGKLPVLDDKELYLVHWRFFYDPPEFQAVLKKTGKSEYHIGYFRDSPEEMPVFLASNNSAKDCHITPMADNIFGAVYLYLQNEKKTSPFISVACQKLMDKVKKWAEEHGYGLEAYNMKKRLYQTVTKTFHGAGIVVPYNKKTQLGYRKLVDTDANIRKLFTRLEAAENQSVKDKILSELQPVITYANIAVDECDFGTGLECGVNLFCSGLRALEPSVLSSLSAAYTLLNREAFGKIIQAHIKYRRKGPNMSILSVSEK